MHTAPASSLKRNDGADEVRPENEHAFLTGSGMLDVKERRGLCQLIYYGGRTPHALVSLWKQHELLSLARRQGATTRTAVRGPTAWPPSPFLCVQVHPVTMLARPNSEFS